MTSIDTKTTLDELNVSDVFHTRLQEESWLSPEEQARKERLSTLFECTVAQVKTEVINESTVNSSEKLKASVKKQGDA